MTRRPPEPAQSYTYEAKFSERTPFASESDWFSKNPQVAGMSADDNRVIVNPNNPYMNDPKKRAALVQLETARSMWKELPETFSGFDVTPQQSATIAGHDPQGPYAKSVDLMARTAASRALAGDLPGMTPAQEEQRRALREAIQANLSGRARRSAE